MKKSCWNIYTLKKRLNTIQKLILTEQNPERKSLLENDYLTLLKHFSDYYDDLNNKQKLLENFQNMKDTYLPFRFLWNDLKYINEIALVTKDLPKLKALNIKEDDILELTNDFFCSLDNYFYERFYNIFKQRKTHVAFKPFKSYSTYDGLSIGLPSLNEYFIEILRRYNLNDVFTCIHEYTHTTSMSINPYHLTTEKTLYTEIDSLFMELIAADFLKEILKSDEIDIININKLEDIFSFSTEINDSINLIIAEEKYNKKINSNKVLKKLAKENCDLLEDEVEELLDYPESYCSINLVSYMFAIELYYLYKEDKEKALYYLKKIILLENLSIEEYYYKIKELGIKPNLNFQKFQQEKYNDYLNLTRKKSRN